MKKLSLLTLFLLAVIHGLFSQTATGVITQVPCNNDGIYTVTTTGMTLPITYTYYYGGKTIVHANVNSATDQLNNISMDPFGYISCAVSSGSVNRWTSDSYTPSFTFTTSAVSPVCPATMGTVTATHTGGTAGPFSYLWTEKQTALTYTGNNVSVPIGEYTVQITDITSGCVLSVTDSSTYVHQLSTVTATVTTTNASCTNGTASAVASGGVAPYTYSWTTGATTANITGLSQGYYPLEVTDAIGCKSNNLGAFIQQNPQVTVNATVTNATCIQSDGSVLAFGSGGVPPYTYAWSNGQTGNNATNLTGGNSYQVIATDVNGCTGRRWTYVGTTTPINVTFTTTSSSCTSPTGSATLSISGGTAPYTTVWNGNSSTTGNTLSNVSAGAYSFSVTDAVGCVRNGVVEVQPIGIINANVQVSPVVCPASNGVATMSVNGSNPPFTYKWNTGQTTNQISGLASGSYTCVITDAIGCSISKVAIVGSKSPVNVGLSTTPASCIFNKDGGVTTSVTGGTAPYTYRYSNGATTANVSNLGVGRHSLTVTDANNCSTTKTIWITDAKTTNSCYCTIEGHVYTDANTNCTYDPSENGINNIMVHCSGIGYVFTDANGYYSFQVPTGTYTISENVNAYYPLASCQSNNISVSVTAASNCSSVIDIANTVNAISDIKMVTINNVLPPIPGNNYQQKVITTNIGTVTESGIKMGYERDSQVPFSSSSWSNFQQPNATAAPYNYAVQSGFPSLAPSASSVMLLNYATPTNIPLGTQLDYHDTVANTAPIDVNWLLDYSPWNNVNTHQPIVVSSYDPNYIEVSPRGEGDPGYIPLSVKDFDYTIHFQNEGTYYAQNIVITNQLDSDFDVSTFVPGYSEYDFYVEISETGLVTFTFPNINLPWKSSFGDPLSSGFVTYTIQRKPSTPIGTEFTSTADIYFDYNEPITTNTTLNTLRIGTGIDDQGSGNSIPDVVSVDLYPIPANEFITVDLKNVSRDQGLMFTMFDIMGKVIFSERYGVTEGSNVFNKNISELQTGTYFCVFQLEDGSVLRKKVVFY